MPEYVNIKPELIRWAITRSRLPMDEFHKFPKLEKWKSGESMPTFKQLEDLAKKTMAPLGYFFLDTPPEEKLPVPDFRTIGDTPIDLPSPDLIETMHTMQRRQTWMSDFLAEEGHRPLEFIGCAKNIRNVELLTARIRKNLGLNADWAKRKSTWEKALRTLRQSIEQIGVLVSTNYMVGLNTHRILDPQEFRGFVLCDNYAPLIFINGADSKSAQMFTLAHELVHLWIGQDGLFNLIKTMPHKNATEKFCNKVAAEFLVPGKVLEEQWKNVKTKSKPFHEIARLFKVSPIAVARRALDLNLITRKKFFDFYQQDQDEWQRWKAKEKLKAKKKKTPRDFKVAHDLRLGSRFASAVVLAAREGRLLYRDAYQLTDIKGETYSKYAQYVLQRLKDER